MLHLLQEHHARLSAQGYRRTRRKGNTALGARPPQAPPLSRGATRKPLHPICKPRLRDRVGKENQTINIRTT
ncbi:hypothetical protein AXF42_Ash018396 [Apostasia shenzhenica]|uniref:Uncharacterized protein n=1 Tax=Apostasia shenzhenica TaxID=1088818 RepID=A0A2I0BE75_9ASPA|nr:hypothetical protein AXF42_Ash018396 [Apostasia shenzhenica]